MRLRRAQRWPDPRWGARYARNRLAAAVRWRECPLPAPEGVAPSEILVVDDDPAVSGSLDRALRLEGYEVETASDGTEALRSLAVASPTRSSSTSSSPMSTASRCAGGCGRSATTTPVLMLTARDAVNDRVAGLDRRADDYLVKPSRSPNSSPGCAPCCAGAPRTTVRSSSAAISRST